MLSDETDASLRERFSRVPRHVGIIPDGNRRWAEARGRSRAEGYAAGVEAGVRLFGLCRALGIEEISVYGFTKENVHRPAEQVEAFREACERMAALALSFGAGLLAVGDTDSPLFPESLLPYARQRSPGELRLNLLVNYGWQWDVLRAVEAAKTRPVTVTGLSRAIGSAQVSRVDLVVRWGGHNRLSGFLPLQCAYADLHVIDALWPDAQPEEFLDALEWYQRQDVTLGG